MKRFINTNRATHARRRKNPFADELVKRPRLGVGRLHRLVVVEARQTFQPSSAALRTNDVLWRWTSMPERLMHAIRPYEIAERASVSGLQQHLGRRDTLTGRDPAHFTRAVMQLFASALGRVQRHEC
jgi:hypothetical protein